MAIFAEVARLGSFRAAAKVQKVSPSVISRHISELEDYLGEALLSRSTRKLKLTSVGEGFLVHCNQMLQAANDGLNSVKENSSQGYLRVTLPITLMTSELGRLIKVFNVENPHIDFSFIFDDKNIDIIESGIDVAFRLGPLVNSSFKAKRLSTIHRSIVCSEEYYASIGEINELHDLNKCNWIGRNNPSTLPVLYSPDGEMHTISKQRKFIKVNNIEAVKAFVMSDVGVGLFSDMLIRNELEQGSIKRLLPDWHIESMQLYAVWSAQKTTGQLVKKFVEFMSDNLKKDL